jgi:hypothetical protein
LSVLGRDGKTVSTSEQAIALLEGLKARTHVQVAVYLDMRMQWRDDENLECRIEVEVSPPLADGQDTFMIIQDDAWCRGFIEAFPAGVRAGAMLKDAGIGT